MKKTSNQNNKWKLKKRNKLQKSIKKRSTFAKEFRKKFVPIFLSLTLILTGFMYVMYRQVVSDATKAFNESIESMKRDCDNYYLYMVSSRGFLWDENDEKDFERILSITINKYGATGDFTVPNKGLILTSGFSDFAYNLYAEKIDEHGKSIEIRKDTEDYVYLIEERDHRTTPDISSFYKIYACPVADIREAYDFQMKHRHASDIPVNPSGFARIDSFYLNEQDGSFKPKHISLYTEKLKKQHLYSGGYSEHNEQILEKELSYDQSNVEDWELVDYYAPNYNEEYTAKGRTFYGPYYAGSKKGGEADKVLQHYVKHIIEDISNINEGIQYITFNPVRHGTILEFTYYGYLQFNPIDYGLWDKNMPVDPAHPELGIIGDDILQQDTQNLIKETHPTDTNIFLPTDFNYAYATCIAATMDLGELYGKQIAMYYLCMLIISLLSAFLLARRSYAKLSLQYQMMDYRKALTDSMAHDLKSPLMAISGYAENLKENVYTNQKDIYADKILENIEYMNRIVSDVLELSKAESENADISLEIIDIKALFENLFEKYADSMAEKDISFELQGELKLKADSRMMERVIDNLICNAVTHGLNGCTIEVSLEKTGFTIKNSYDEEAIDTEFLNVKNKKVTIGKHSNQKRTFDALLKPFVKGNKNRTNHQGSGLGLAIAKELLEAQGYTLTISVAEGTFTVIVK